MKFLFLLLVSFLSFSAFAQVERELKSVLSANDKLFESLLQSDQVKVEAAASELSKAIGATRAQQLKQLRAGADLNKMKKTNAKEQNLELYAKVVAHLVPVLKANGVQGYGLYFCPMVKKEWIQNEKMYSSVKNVFVQDMLECGEKLKK